MRPCRISQGRWRHVVLFSLAGWAALLSLETLVRLPGPVGRPPLPAQLSRQGVTLQRRAAAAAPVAALPDGLALIEAADYAPSAGVPSGSGPVRLRLLALTSSGTGVHLPIEPLGAILLGPGGRGRCVVLNASGTVVREMATPQQWQAEASRSSPGVGGVLAWLAGLRPYRPNLCLWESLP